MPAQQEVIKLVERFRRNLKDYQSGKYNETQVRLEFIDPFFEALGWDDPHYLPDAEGYCCEIEGCVEPDTSGTRWGGLYLRLCREHSKDSFDGKPCPKVKQWAIDREAKRDKVTGYLPFSS